MKRTVGPSPDARWPGALSGRSTAPTPGGRAGATASRRRAHHGTHARAWRLEHQDRPARGTQGKTKRSVGRAPAPDAGRPRGAVDSPPPPGVERGPRRAVAVRTTGHTRVRGVSSTRTGPREERRERRRGRWGEPLPRTPGALAGAVDAPHSGSSGGHGDTSRWAPPDTRACVASRAPGPARERNAGKGEEDGGAGPLPRTPGALAGRSTPPARGSRGGYNDARPHTGYARAARTRAATHRRRGGGCGRSRASARGVRRLRDHRCGLGEGRGGGARAAAVHLHRRRAARRGAARRGAGAPARPRPGARHRGGRRRPQRPHRRGGRERADGARGPRGGPQRQGRPAVRRAARSGCARAALGLLAARGAVAGSGCAERRAALSAVPLRGVRRAPPPGARRLRGRGVAAGPASARHRARGARAAARGGAGGDGAPVGGRLAARGGGGSARGATAGCRSRARRFRAAGGRRSRPSSSSPSGRGSPGRSTRAPPRRWRSGG